MNNPELDSKLVQDENKVKVELNVNEVNVVLAALQELPHRVADPILKNIVGQVQMQLAPAQAE